MKPSLILLLFLSVIIFSCHSNDAKKAASEKENYELAKQNLRDKEINHPEIFLDITSGDKHNLLGQTVIRGRIRNKASVAVYKDVNVQLDFYSKTGALLETDNETIYETLQPGSAKNFKTKYFAPKGSDSVGLKILGAKIAE